MAFGFRECCNEFSYFTVTGIPGNVSEFETYYVRTIEGLNFCATYVQLPTLNYQAPNYILLELAQQTSCESCLALFPCPEEDIILVNQFTAGSVQIDTDCQVNTLQPMIVQCQTISPTFSNTLDGTVALLVVGGTPPYTFLGASPSEVLGVFQDGDVYTVYQNVSAGTYTTTTVDSTGDFSITRNCVLTGPPPIPVVTPIVTPASFFGVPDGSIQLNIIGGIPPYTIVYEGEEITLPITNLVAGTYFFQIIDTSGTLVEVEAVVTQPDYPDYPQNLCATYSRCGTEFLLNFQISTELYNYRPIFNCTNPAILGMTNFAIRWDNTGRWRSTSSTIQTENIQFETPPNGCNLNGDIILIEKGIQGPLALPQGSYGCTSSFCGGTVIPVVTGGCPPKVRILSTDNYCAGPPVKLGQVIYEAVGGGGPPYTFFYSSNGVNYTQVTFTQLSLVSGDYSIKVQDSLGTESAVVNFNISSANEVYRTIDFSSNCVSATLTGNQFNGNFADGDYLEFETVLEHFYDLSNMPVGAEFYAKFKVEVEVDTTVGGEGYETPETAQIFNFEIVDAWAIQNGSFNYFFQNPPNVIYSSPNGIQYTTELGADNFGKWKVAYYDSTSSCDNCGNGTVCRTSPNYWYDCNIPGSPIQTYPWGLSFIEGDTRGVKFKNVYQLISPVNIIFNQNTRIYIRFRVRFRINMPLYIPTILNESNLVDNQITLQPAYYNNTGLLEINQPNTNNKSQKSFNSFKILESLVNIFLVSPPSEGCIALDNTFPNINAPTIYNAQGQATGSIPNRFQFTQFNNFFGVNETFLGSTAQGRVNFFRSSNTTGIPDWYNQLAP
jgi:hypothetical protein